MNNAHLYNSSNGLQRRDAQTVVEDYVHLIRWTRDGDGDERILDVGCGDGFVMTNVLVPALPANHTITGVDVSEEMVKYATREYSNSRVNFRVMDLSVRLDKPRERYDHVFSFNCLHWIQDQRTALHNIYSLLNEGGDCIITIIAKNPIYDVYKSLKKLPKWKPYMRDVDKFISPYHKLADPREYVKKLLSEIGFEFTQVDYKERTYYFKGLQTLKKSVFAVTPFLKRMSYTLHDDFFEDYVGFVKDLGLIEESNNNLGDEVTIKTQYTSLIIYARK